MSITLDGEIAEDLESHPFSFWRMDFPTKRVVGDAMVSDEQFEKQRFTTPGHLEFSATLKPGEELVDCPHVFGKM